MLKPVRIRQTDLRLQLTTGIPHWAKDDEGYVFVVAPTPAIRLQAQDLIEQAELGHFKYITGGTIMRMGPMPLVEAECYRELLSLVLMAHGWSIFGEDNWPLRKAAH
jgi:hypothetical protein